MTSATPAPMNDISHRQAHASEQPPAPAITDTQTRADQWIICEHCDSVYEAIALNKGEASYCGRCAAILRRSHRLSIEQLLALSIAACVLFIFANVFPVISISMQGLHNEVTLWGSVQALAQGQITLIALVAGLAVILAPALQIALLFWVLVHAHRDEIAPGFKMCMRTLEHLRPWSMLEVCLLGILVAIVKLAGMLDVHAGAGLWAMAMLMVLILLIAGKDIRRLWDELGVRPE
jgi:paraquat-inducible protein A